MTYVDRFVMDLNNTGQIALQGGLSNATYGILLLTPVPEPSTLALMLSGMFALWLLRRPSRFRLHSSQRDVHDS